MRTLFGTDGVRGKANAYPINPETVLQLGKALARVFKASGHGSQRAVIGKDTRLSGYMLETALTSGLVSMGMDVYLVGPLPTPAVAHLTRSMVAGCGIMITASHNPADDNGIKVFGTDGFKLTDALEEEVEKYVLEGGISSAHIPNDQLGKAYRIDDARGRYIEFAKSTVPDLDLHGLKVVVDCANGAAYLLGPIILRELGAQVIKLATDPDGYNINDGCGATAPDAVCRKVREVGADLGVAFDGDADRVVFCDRHGDVIHGDRILALCALALKEQGRLRRDTAVVTVMTNLGFHRAMAARGIRTVTTPVGDRHVIDCMRREGYSFGGEQSGHLIFMDHATTGDGIVSALQVLRLMGRAGTSVNDLTGFMEIYPQKLVNVPVREKRDLAQLPELAAATRECAAALGDDGRQLVRYSGTEKSLRILVEAVRQADVDHWSARLAAAAQREIGV